MLGRGGICQFMQEREAERRKDRRRLFGGLGRLGKGKGQENGIWVSQGGWSDGNGGWV